MSLVTDAGSPAGQGRLHSANSVADRALAELVGVYKRTIAGRYRGLRREELEELPHGKLHLSPKIDGELWYMVLDDGAPALISHNGRVLRGRVPLLVDAERNYAERAPAGTVVAGELFAVGGRDRPRVGDVSSALSGSTDIARLGFHAFDVVHVGGEPAPDSYPERLALLQGWFEGGKRVAAIKTEVIASHAEAADLYETWVASGKAEGLVARSEDGRIFKIKPAFHLDCAVVGYTQRADEPELVRSLLLSLVRPDGTHQIVGSVGAIGSVEQRGELYRALQGTEVPSAFRRVSSSGALYRLTRPKLVVEVVVTDVFAEDRSGRPIQQWALELDEEQGWLQVCPVSGASLLHPTMERVRDDKRVDGTDVRVSQLEERCPVSDLDVVAEAPDLAASTVIRREVYSKTTKGKLAVRKLLVWKTNKEQADPDFPPYVVHFTDYSVGRKDPLKREVRLAADEAEATELAEAMLVKNIKRGWVRADEG